MTLKFNGVEWISKAKLELEQCIMDHAGVKRKLSFLNYPYSYFKKKEALNSNVSGRLWCLEVTLFFCGKKGSNFKALF